MSQVDPKPSNAPPKVPKRQVDLDAPSSEAEEDQQEEAARRSSTKKQRTDAPK
jgi:hypothetical protein